MALSASKIDRREPIVPALLASAVIFFITVFSGGWQPVYGAATSPDPVVQTSKPTTLDQDDEPGVSIALSNHSTLDINVQCIFDYVQGEENTFTDLQEWQRALIPWVRLHFSF
ncbi:hypothetical protein DESC_920028 [Desulfosarcina cetonica]|uniref:hypothetical protein n=1 Tax=Desulfosarcina cetonica TaxID=90730 RepID=UPI0006D05C0C|nr:hypothetical protein [Desulfosarcina cetonica]VTR71289.1 hypothetical protein DESC_920028 [Desulfosarcina cetonica]